MGQSLEYDELFPDPVENISDNIHAEAGIRELLGEGVAFGNDTSEAIEADAWMKELNQDLRDAMDVKAWADLFPDAPDVSGNAGDPNRDPDDYITPAWGKDTGGKGSGKDDDGGSTKSGDPDDVYRPAGSGDRFDTTPPKNDDDIFRLKDDPNPMDDFGGGREIPAELQHVLNVPGIGPASDPAPDGGDSGSGLPPFIKNPLGPLGFDPEAGDTGVTSVRGGGGDHLPFRDPRGPGMMPVPDGDGPMGPAADGLHPIGSIGGASLATWFALGER